MQILYCSCKGFGDLMLDKIRTMQKEELSFSSVEEEFTCTFSRVCADLCIRTVQPKLPHACNE